jgi:hypothetical protein
METLNRKKVSAITSRFYKPEYSLVHISRIIFLIAASISISINYSQIGLNLVAYTPLLLDLFWIIGVCTNIYWLSDLVFVLFTILSGAGFILHANSYIMLLAFFSALIFWDLDHFSAMINSFDNIDDFSQTVLGHIKTLCQALGLSLLLIILAWQIQISISLILALILAGGAILSIRWIFSSLHKRLND